MKVKSDEKLKQRRKIKEVAFILPRYNKNRIKAKRQISL